MTNTLNHMTKQSLHISHDCPTESHDHTKLAHTITKEKIKQMARKIYIECEGHHDGTDGILTWKRSPFLQQREVLCSDCKY